MCCKLTLIYGLVCDFCSSGQSFAHQGTFQPLKSGFLQIPPHDGHPCLWLNLPATGRLRDFHPTERALTGRTAKGGDSSESPPGVFWLQKALLAKASQATMHTGSGCRRPEEASCRTAVQHPNHASQSPQLFAAREPAPAGNGSRWQNCPCPATRSAHPPV